MTAAAVELELQKEHLEILVLAIAVLASPMAKAVLLVDARTVRIQLRIIRIIIMAGILAQRR